MVSKRLLNSMKIYNNLINRIRFPTISIIWKTNLNLQFLLRDFEWVSTIAERICSDISKGRLQGVNSKIVCFNLCSNSPRSSTCFSNYKSPYVAGFLQQKQNPTWPQSWSTQLPNTPMCCRRTKNYLIQLNNSKLQAITKMSSQIVYPSTASECYLMLQLLHIQWHMFN